jgi:transcription factor TFIIIB component B''
MDQPLKHYLKNANFKRSRQSRKKAPRTVKKGEDREQNDILTVKNGEIVINEANMFIDTRKDIEMEVLEDDTAVTSATYGKRGKPKRWSEGDTELFYKALEICGTEFSLIGSLFPNRERKQIKAKYLRECKLNPERIDDALKFHKSFDDEAFEKLCKSVND